MKIKTEHYEHLKSAIATLDHGDIASHKKGVFASKKFKDFQKRMRWDCLHAVVPSKWVCDNLYPYMDDTHIDTALRSIVDELKLDLSEPRS